MANAKREIFSSSGLPVGFSPPILLAGDDSRFPKHFASIHFADAAPMPVDFVASWSVSGDTSISDFVRDLGTDFFRDLATATDGKHDVANLKARNYLNETRR